jgi:hypothetical protein
MTRIKRVAAHAFHALFAAVFSTTFQAYGDQLTSKHLENNQQTNKTEEASLREPKHFLMMGCGLGCPGYWVCAIMF